jgi:hypothetical protein
MRRSLLLLLAVGCGGRAREPERPAPPADAVVDAPAGVDDVPIDDGRPRERVTLDDAIARGLVEMQASGAGVHHVWLEVKARADLELVVPTGTFFASGSAQNMIVRDELVALLDRDRPRGLELDTACANFHRPVPRRSDRFELAVADPALDRLVDCLDEHHVDARRRQLLVWQQTDGVERGDLVRRRDMLKPYLVEACTDRLRRSPEPCRSLVDAAYETYVDRLLADHDGSACVATSDAAGAPE